jgi:peptidoglycan/xylan/chitin deacetylase (PgdA/CDA1 family)
VVRPEDRLGVGPGYPAFGLARDEIILTFDDGPKPGTTSQILDILARECIHATFFMIGKRAEAHPELVRRALADGHSVGSHSYTHRRLDTLAPEEATEDIERGYEAIEKAAFGSAAERPRLIRFPEYKSTPALVAFVQAHKGIIANTHISPEDWRGQPAEQTMVRLKSLFDRRSNGILGLHDDQPHTVELLPMIIAEMKARHLRVVHLVVK